MDKRLYWGERARIKIFSGIFLLSGRTIFRREYYSYFTGAFSGTGAPNSGRFSALTKSPLTNILVHSSCGGNFGIALKETGFDGIIIKGRLKNWKIIKIDENSVKFLDATHLLGKGTKESQNILNLNSKEGLLTIGPAGENKVLYANVRSDDRFFGRGGIGAVFGDKKIKAIIAKGGKYKIKPHDEKKFNRYKKTANKMLISNSFTGYYYRNFGTNSNILLNNRGKILPVRNFTRGSHKKAELISGEKIKKNHTTGFQHANLAQYFVVIRVTLIIKNSMFPNMKQPLFSVQILKYLTLFLLPKLMNFAII